MKKYNELSASRCQGSPHEEVKKYAHEKLRDAVDFSHHAVEFSACHAASRKTYIFGYVWKLSTQSVTPPKMGQ